MFPKLDISVLQQQKLHCNSYSQTFTADSETGQYNGDGRLQERVSKETDKRFNSTNLWSSGHLSNFDKAGPCKNVIVLGFSWVVKLGHMHMWTPRYHDVRNRAQSALLPSFLSLSLSLFILKKRKRKITKPPPSRMEITLKLNDLKNLRWSPWCLL